MDRADKLWEGIPINKDKILVGAYNRYPVHCAGCKKPFFVFPGVSAQQRCPWCQAMVDVPEQPPVEHTRI